MTSLHSFLRRAVIRRSVLVFALFALASACAESAPRSPVSIGGGSVRIVASADACPTDHPRRFEAGDAVVCADASYAIGATTLHECAEHDLDCAALYGCGGLDFASCVSTNTTADCGGDGPPAFACTKTAGAFGCRWFVGGCPPDGWVASTCPAGDLCCHEPEFGSPGTTGDEGAPFPTGTLGAPTTLNANLLASQFTAEYGSQPVGLDDGYVIPVVDATLPDESGVVVDCTAASSEPIFCMWTDRSASGDGETTFRVVATNLGQQGFDVELRTVLGARVARVCPFLVADAASSSCDSNEPALDGCYGEGLVELDATRVRVSVDGVVVSFPR